MGMTARTALLTVKASALTVPNTVGEGLMSLMKSWTQAVGLLVYYVLRKYGL